MYFPAKTGHFIFESNSIHTEYPPVKYFQKLTRSFVKELQYLVLSVCYIKVFIKNIIRFKNNIGLAIKVLCAVLICFLHCSCINRSVPGEEVVATTSWTAAYALAAGVKDVSVLAPFEMIHPSEYELRPGDIIRLKRAKVIIFAGYEVMVKQLKSGLQIPEDKLLQISTTYRFAELEESVMNIAKKTGTEKEAIKNLKEIKYFMNEGRLAIKEKGLNKSTVLVHFFQVPFLEEMEIPAYAIFGPAPLEPKQILAVKDARVDIIIDNAHNPVGGPMRELMKNAEYILLINFPGLNNTRTIADVIRHNIDQLINAH